MSCQAGRRVARSVFRRLVDLAAPVIGLNVLGVLSLAVDTAMCGRLPDNEVALQALGFATQVVFLLMVLMIGLSVGAVAMVARRHGAGRHDEVLHVLRQAVMLTVVLGGLVALLGNVGGPFVLRALGAPENVLPLAMDYLRPSAGFAVFFYLNTLFAAVLRGVGHTRLPFFVALLSNALNVVLNLGLILGRWGLPALGVGGAAIGTVSSQAVGLVILVAVLRRGVVAGITAPIRPTAIDPVIARELVRIGAPAALDMVILNAGFATIVGMLGRIDPITVAAHALGLRVQALAFVPGLSVSQATGALVGNALGARDLDQARSVVKAAIVLCTAIMSALAIGIIAGAPQIVSIFEVPPTSHLGELSMLWMRVLGYGMPIVGVHIALIGMLRGAGATSTSLAINVVGTVLVQVPLSYVLGFPAGLGAFGIWLAFPLSFVAKAAMGVWAYRSGRWARTKI